MNRTLAFLTRAGKSILGYVKRTYVIYWLVVLACSVYSLMLVYSCTGTSGSLRTVLTQLIACVIGYTAAVVISLMDYEKLGELWYLVAGFCLVLVGLTFIIGQGAQGAYSTADDKAWLNIFGVSFQPSELMKIGFLITFSYHLANTIKAGNINSLPHIFLLLGHIMVPVGLIVFQGDHGTALMFLVMAIFILIGSGVDWKYILAGFLALIAVLPILWQVLSPDQQERFRAVYNPKEGDELGHLYQQTLGRYAIGSGGLTGAGWTDGRMIQSGLVPADHNDFIFVVAAEEFGFIGATVLVILLVGVMILTLKAGLEARDDMGRFICLGFFGLIAAQTMFNLGMCLVVLPVIGITLPFFSAGGSSSMCLYFGFGLVLSVYMRRNVSNMQFAIR